MRGGRNRIGIGGEREGVGTRDRLTAAGHTQHVSCRPAALDAGDHLPPYAAPGQHGYYGPRVVHVPRQHQGREHDAWSRHGHRAGVFIETFLACKLVFMVLILAAEKSKDTFLAPVGIRLALFTKLADESGSLSFFLRQVMRRDKGLTEWIECVYYTGGSLDPTRSFGLLLPGLGFLDTTGFTGLGYFWVPRFRRGIIIS